MEQSFSLIISDLRIWVHLGCGEEEKIHPQMVSIDVDIIFSKIPSAVVTDNIEDAACYLIISRSIQELLTSRRFNLIEHMSVEVHKVVSQSLLDKADIISMIKVSLRKVSPPVPGLHGGVAAIYSSPLSV
jgi:dihydroneopterin aldolase